MGGDRDPQSIASAFLLTFLFHNTLVSGDAGAHLWGGIICPSRRGPDTLVPVTERGGKEGREGAACRRRNLTLGGHFIAISARNLHRPAISSKSASHSQDISTLQRERLAGKSVSGGRLPSTKRGGKKPPRGRLTCRFSGIQTHLVQFMRLWTCSTVRVVCSW